MLDRGAMRRPLLAVLVAAHMLGVVGCGAKERYSVAKEDVLECGLADGRKFVLRSKYLFSPTARFVPSGHVTDRVNQEPYKAEPNSGDGAVVGRMMYSVRYEGADRRAHVQACGNFGMLRGVALVRWSFLEPDGKWFDAALLPNRLQLSPVLDEQAAEVRKRLAELELSPEYLYAFVFPAGTRLVYEQPLLDPRGEVAYVAQAFSTDHGASWSEPSITKQAQIFELGRRMQAQSFLAKPLAFNGVKLGGG